MKELLKRNFGKIITVALIGVALIGVLVFLGTILGYNAQVEAEQSRAVVTAETFRGATQKVDACNIEIKYVETGMVCFVLSSSEDAELDISNVGTVAVTSKKKTEIKVPLTNEKNNTVLITGDTVVAKYNFGGWKKRGLVPHPEGIINGKSEVEIFNNSVISTPGFDATYMSMEKYGGYKVTVRLGNIIEEINEISAVQYFTKDEETYSMPVGEIERINLVNGTVDFVFHTEYFGADYQHDLHVLINGRTIVIKNYAKV